MPGWSSRWGATASTSPRMLVWGSAASAVRVLIRGARLRRACLVAVSSSRGAAGSRNAAHLVTWAAVVRPRSWSRGSTGALMMRALSSLIAAVRAVWAPRRVVSSARSASRRPRARGTARSGRPRTSRAARRASRASVLAPSLVAAVAGVAELDHQLAGRDGVRARSGPVAARALHGPGPRLWRRGAVRARHEPLVAPAGRLERRGRQLAARGRLHQRRRYLVSIRVDADHTIHDVCQHDASPLSVSCAHRKGPAATTL